MGAGVDRRLEVTPHAAGPWLVKWGDRRFAVTPEVGRDLAEGALPVDLLKDMGEGQPSHRARPIWVRKTVFSANTTTVLSKILTHWVATYCLVFFALMGALAYLVVDWRLVAPGGLGGWLAGFGLIIATALWHELGHAAALQREGYPPGGIGVGILFVVPVLWADVTPVAALPRRRRIRVDLAGVCFQLGAGGLCAVIAATEGPGTAVFGMGAAGALAAVIWSLLPFMRTDGYWALCDLLGLEDLDRPPPLGSSRALSRFVAVFRVANGLFLIFVVVWIPQRIFGLVLLVADLAGFEPGNPAVRGFAVLVSMAVFGGLAWRAWRRLRRLIFS